MCIKKRLAAHSEGCPGTGKNIGRIWLSPFVGELVAERQKVKFKLPPQVDKTPDKRELLFKRENIGCIRAISRYLTSNQIGFYCPVKIEVLPVDHTPGKSRMKVKPRSVGIAQVKGCPQCSAGFMSVFLRFSFVYAK
jgi:hypothetical protein